MQLGPKVFCGTGIALLLLAAYMAGEDTLRCDRANGRVDCVAVRERWLGNAVVEQQWIMDVVKAGVHTSTTSTTWYTSFGNPEITTNTNEVLVLRTRNGHDTDTLGGERSGDFAEAVTALIGPSKTPVLHLSDSNWPVAAACGGLGVFFFTFGAIAYLVQRRENRRRRLAARRHRDSSRTESSR